jgi:hypothetical protein
MVRGRFRRSGRLPAPRRRFARLLAAAVVTEAFDEAVAKAATDREALDLFRERMAKLYVCRLTELAFLRLDTPTLRHRQLNLKGLLIEPSPTQTIESNPTRNSQIERPRGAIFKQDHATMTAALDTSFAALPPQPPIDAHREQRLVARFNARYPSSPNRVSTTDVWNIDCRCGGSFDVFVRSSVRPSRPADANAATTRATGIAPIRQRGVRRSLTSRARRSKSAGRRIDIIKPSWPRTMPDRPLIDTRGPASWTPWMFFGCTRLRLAGAVCVQRTRVISRRARSASLSKLRVGF